MSLFTVTMLVQGINTPIRLMFKFEERAKQAHAAQVGVDGVFALNDDFGVEIRLETAPVVRILCDVEQELAGNIEASLLQARAQQEVQKRAAHDANLSSRILSPNGPVIPFSPRN